MTDEDARPPAQNVPNPDPSFRTEERLRREIHNVGESFAKDIDCINEVMSEKFKGAHDRFGFIEQRFVDLEARTAEQKRDTKDAVDAALQAAKEAVGQQTEASERSIAKSEAASTKQIDAVTTQRTSDQVSTDGKIDDLKSRMDRMESAKLGGAETKTDQRAFVASLVGVALVVVAVASVVIALIASKP